MRMEALKREERKGRMDRGGNGEREEASFKGRSVKRGTEARDTEKFLHP